MFYPNYPGSRPGTHAASHGPGGTDPLDLAALGAQQAALVVANDAARFALSASAAPLGTVVQVTATGNNYVVADTANLGNENGYVILPPAGPAQVIVRQGTASEIAAVTLASGEIAYATDTKDTYMGDGSTLGGVLWSRGSLVLGREGRPTAGANGGGSGTPGNAGVTPESTYGIVSIRPGNGGASGSVSGNGGNGGSQTMSIVMRGGDGGAAGPASNGGNGGPGSSLTIRGGAGGAGAASGAGVGGAGGIARSISISAGGGGAGGDTGGAGGAGGNAASGLTAISIGGGTGGAGSTASGGAGGTGGAITMSGGLGGNANGATPGAAGGRGGIITMSGSSASLATAGANAGDITTSANGPRAGGSINTSAGAAAAGGSLDISNSGIIIRTGTGTPEGVVTAAVGSLFLRTDGGAATTLYVKESGSGNTGWVGK